MANYNHHHNHNHNHQHHINNNNNNNNNNAINSHQLGPVLPWSPSKRQRLVSPTLASFTSSHDEFFGAQSATPSYGTMVHPHFAAAAVAAAASSNAVDHGAWHSLSQLGRISESKLAVGEAMLRSNLQLDSIPRALTTRSDSTSLENDEEEEDEESSWPGQSSGAGGPNEPTGAARHRRPIAKRDRDRNRLACKQFREKRKREMHTLMQRNLQMERDRDLYRSRIAELQNEAQMFRHQGLQDLETENHFLRAQVDKHRMAVRAILGVSQQIDSQLALGPDERAQILGTAVDSCISRVLGSGYASLQWRYGRPFYTGRLPTDFRFQLLPEGTERFEHAQRINVRFDMIVPRSAAALSDAVWAWIADPAKSMRTADGSRVVSFPVDLGLGSRTHNIGAAVRLAKVNSVVSRDGRVAPAFYLAARRETAVYPSALRPPGDAAAALMPERSVARVCVRTSCSPSFLQRLHLAGIDESTSQSMNEDKVLVGVIVHEDPRDSRMAHLTVLESHPLRGFQDVLRPAVNATGALASEYASALAEILAECMGP